MSEIMLTVSYKSLGKILEQLRDSAEVKGSHELAGRVDNAISFHQQMAAEMQALSQEHQLLKQNLSDATREPGERVCSESNPNRFANYEEMKNTGATPQEVYSAARNDGFNQIEAIAALRKVFNLPLQEAQDVLLQMDDQFHKHAA